MHSTFPADGRADEADHDPLGWRQEGQDLLRAVAAGTLVGMPLLFTMEMWWWGMLLSEWHLLAILGLTLAVNYVFCLFSGFRHEFTWLEAFSEAVGSVGIGIVLSAAILLLIRELSLDLAPAEIIGKVLIEAIPVSIGVSYANTKFLGQSGDDEAEDNEVSDESGVSPEQSQLRQDLREAGAAAGGALLFSFNAAPTEEILMIQSHLPAWQLCAMIPASFALCYIILFASGLKEYRVSVKSFFQRPLVETVLAYAIALVVSFGLLYMVGPPIAMSSPSTAIGCTVVLGVEAAVGAAAGRLAS